MIAQKRTEKISFNIPSDLKAKVVELKDEMSMSLNAIYKQAITEYVEKQEIKKWKRSVDLALQNKEYLKSCEEAGDIVGELYEYGD